jgi:hypothetical protein
MTEFVETLRHKLEGRGFEYRCGKWDFVPLIPSGYTIVLGSNQPLTKMSASSMFWFVNVAAA